ncbi:MAG: ANTAR domain-containing protein [bacterium]|nr:ANTAR domain-containing protein [bacterium]
MLSIIVAFPKAEDAKNIRNVLIRNGFEVSATCTSGAQVVTIANELDGGIILCGYRLNDMHYLQLHNYLPVGFEMLLIASPAKLGEVTNNSIVCVSMPIKMNDLLNTLQMMAYNYYRRLKKNKLLESRKPKQRNQKDKETINKAKVLLMERNNLTEEEAHRYIQKTSMDSGTNMVETAEMLLQLM